MADNNGASPSAGLTAVVVVGVVLFVVVIILIVVLWYRSCGHMNKMREDLDKCASQCSSNDDQCTAVEQRCKDGKGGMANQIKNATKTQHSLLGMWSFDFTSIADTLAPNGTLPPTPMLLSVASPQGATILTTAQANTSSVIPMPWGGTVQALTVEMPALVSTGSVTLTLTVNAQPTTLTYTYTAATPTMFSATKLPVTFVAGDTLGVQMSTNGFSTTASDATVTAQLFGAFSA